MQVKDRIVVVTGAASGIGRALAQRFHQEGAKLVVCADINADGVKATAAGIGGVAFVTVSPVGAVARAESERSASPG